MQKISLVITTINEPNKVIKKYFALTKKNKVDYILVGDEKTPKYNTKYPLINLKKQKYLNFSINRLLPNNSYSRKNIGYLIAMKNNSKIIVETDDDNYPKENFFKNLHIQKLLNVLSGPKWINILQIFSKTNKTIWPRGFPLNLINNNVNIKRNIRKINSPVQQRMCDGNPDVDAIYRLTNKFKNHTFKNANFAINPKSLCPFNSQNTVWHEIAFPLMYLPSYCTMRATDIWRSFVTLRIMKNYDWHLSFLKSTVIQYRNIHNLMDDFTQEVPVYKNTVIFNEVLEKIELSKNYDDMLINIFKCYNELVNNKIIEKKELKLLKEWLLDVGKIYPNFKKIKI